MTWRGRRDRALLMLALQTGLRVSELINLSSSDVVLGARSARRMLRQGSQGASNANPQGQYKGIAWLADRTRQRDRPPIREYS